MRNSCTAREHLARLSSLFTASAAMAFYPASSYAQEALQAESAPVTSSVSIPTVTTSKTDGLLGDWAGMKPGLFDSGIDLNANYVFEPARNLSGGDRDITRGAGQFTVAADLDFDKIAGIQGGTGKIMINVRHGKDLSGDANLGTVQQVVEIYGRGNFARLTMVWYEQQIGKLAIKVGRQSVSEDFATFHCDFINLGLCGGQPGMIAGAYWYHWPVSNWGVRAKYAITDKLSFQTAAYAVDTDNLRHGFSLRAPWRGESALIPFEFKWENIAEASHRKTSIRLGGWYNTGRSAFDRVIPDNSGLLRKGRYGAYVLAQHELLRPDPMNADRHLDVFFRSSIIDKRTGPIRAQYTVGGVYYGWIAQRPKDWIGFGVAANRVNRPLVNTSADPRPNDYEVAFEGFYNLSMTNWFSLRPSFQYVRHPGGREDGHDATVIGLKASLTL